MAFDDNSSTYSDYLAKVRDAQRRMSLGFQTLQDDFSSVSLGDRFRHNMTGLGFMSNSESAFNPYEQRAMSRADKLSRMGLKGTDLVYGGLDLGLSLVPGGSMALGKAAMFTSIGGAATGSGALMQAGGILGTLQNFSNPAYLAGSLGIKMFETGFSEGIVNPYVNARMMQASVFGATRNVLGGQQSLLGTGGLSMSQSLGMGQAFQGITRGIRDVSPEQVSGFLKASADMPQMQFVTNSEQAIENMSKFTNLMIELARKFKGKDKELIEAFRQFGQMGMTLDQSKRAFETTHMGGTFLNVDPSKIMGVGQSASQMAIGTGVSQGTMYMAGTQNFMQAERMRQSGQFSQTQIQNFGGTEGIAQITTGIQSKFFNSPLADLFLKSVYDGSGIDDGMMQKLTHGRLGLGEARYGASKVTLDPRKNMSYAFNKDEIISNLGENYNSVFYSSMDQLFANRSPFGISMEGRARWMQSIGLVQDPQQAKLMAQQWMSYNPHMEEIRRGIQTDSMMAGNDPFFSSQSGAVRWLNRASSDIGNTWQTFSRWSGIDNTGKTRVDLNYQLGAMADNLTLGAASGVFNWFNKAGSTRDMQDFMPWSGFSQKDYMQTAKSLKGFNIGIDPSQREAMNIGRSLPYARVESYTQDQDKDQIKMIQSEITDYKNQGKAKDEIKDILTKKYDLGNRTFTGLNNVPIQGTQMLEGSINEAMYDRETLNQSQSLMLKNQGRSKLQGWKGASTWGVIGAGVAAGAGIGSMVGAIGGFGIGALPGGVVGAIGGGIIGLGTALIGGKSGIGKQYESFQKKFDIATGEEQTKMANLVKRIANSSGDDYITGADESLLAGMQMSKSDAIAMYNNSRSEFDAMSTIGKSNSEIGEITKRQKAGEFMRNVDTIWGSDTYKSISRELKAGDNGIQNLITNFYQGNTSTGVQFKNKSEFNEFKQGLTSEAGLRDLSKFLAFDEASGNVSFKKGALKGKTNEDLLKSLFMATGGRVDPMVADPTKYWEKHSGDKANTIMDFANAVAKGLQIYNSGEGGKLANNWNPSIDTSKEGKDKLYNLRGVNS